MKKHAFAAKMVDEKKQALNPYEDLFASKTSRNLIGSEP